MIHARNEVVPNFRTKLCNEKEMPCYLTIFPETGGGNLSPLAVKHVASRSQSLRLGPGFYSSFSLLIVGMCRRRLSCLPRICRQFRLRTRTIRFFLNYREAANLA